MYPLLKELSTNPAILSAAQEAMKDLKPVLHEAFARRSSKLLFVGGGALTACFAAGLAVGWLTAPRKGAQLRASAQDNLKAWARWAGSIVRREDTVHDGLDGAPSHPSTEMRAAADGSVEVTIPN